MVPRTPRGAGQGPAEGPRAEGSKSLWLPRGLRALREVLHAGQSIRILHTVLLAFGAGLFLQGSPALASTFGPSKSIPYATFQGAMAGEPLNLCQPDDDSYDWGPCYDWDFSVLRSSINALYQNGVTLSSLTITQTLNVGGRSSLNDLWVSPTGTVCLGCGGNVTPYVTQGLDVGFLNSVFGPAALNSNGVGAAVLLEGSVQAIQGNEEADSLRLLSYGNSGDATMTVGTLTAPNGADGHGLWSHPSATTFGITSVGEMAHIGPDGLAVTYGVRGGSVTVTNTVLTSTTSILAGPVGIGTASPGAAVDVLTNSAGGLVGQFINTSATGYGVRMRSGTGASGNYVLSLEDKNNTIHHQFLDTGEVHLGVGGGNIGIGTASPGSLFTVSANTFTVTSGGIVSAPSQPGAMAREVADEPLPSTVVTQLFFGDAACSNGCYNTSNVWGGATSSGTFTTHGAGTYFVHCQAVISGATATTLLTVYVSDGISNTNVYAQDQRSLGSANTGVISASNIVHLADAQNVQCNLRADTAGVTAPGSIATNMTVQKLW